MILVLYEIGIVANAVEESDGRISRPISPARVPRQYFDGRNS